MTAPTREAVAELVRTELEGEVAGWLFSHTATASTHGLRLADGRRVVVKVHPAGAADPVRLERARTAQRHLRDAGFPCPEPLGRVRALGASPVTVESFLAAGETPRADDPAAHAALAAGLQEMVRLLSGLDGLEPLDAERLGRYPLDPLWLGSHDPAVDFDASAGGAEWIDAIAREARRRRYSTPIGRVVVGHNDWRVEHVRLSRGELTAAYDWDSLVRTREPLLVASAIRGFTADWRASFDPVVPTLEQVRHFLDVYEHARGARFQAVERTLIYAGWIDALAYAARWEHGRGTPGAGEFQRRLADDAPALLGL